MASSSSSSHPRRVPVTRLGSGNPQSLKIAMINKCSSFHSPSSPLAEDSSFSPPQLARAQSSPDDVIDAHRRRVALTLDSINRTLAGTHISSPTKVSAASTAFDLFLDNGHSVPHGILSHTVVAPSTTSSTPTVRRVLQPRSPNRRIVNQHTSDSGLGSSVASSGQKMQQKQPQQQQGPSTRTHKKVQVMTVTRSAAAPSATAEKPVGLSPRATNRIYEHTVKPLLAKSTFKPFHPILLECTTKINKKDIVCLRDLEKTILLLAPERNQVAKLYLEFCLESVCCFQTTVEFLTDREQTRPSDAPYTAGYFIDLVDQIHHYAQQLADAKEKEKSGIKTSSTMEFHSTDEIKLHGGITVNGRPAELVRIGRDGRAVSIATGLPVELEEDVKDTIRIKRSASQEREDEEEIMRSMARRKKNAPPEEYAPKQCSVPGCTKEFKRPCDLTKHEKTHSRPWKCPIPSCKYHEYGWPTEKEKDRHLNDKHSDNPPMYECLFKPCTYKSKRDSNRKQHMEKTHGWKYIRTKTANSKPGNEASAPQFTSARPSMEAGSSTTQPTPQLVNMPTPVSAQSPNVATPPVDEFSAPLFNEPFFSCAPSDVMSGLPLPAELTDMDFAPVDLDNNLDAVMDALDNDAAIYASPSNTSSLDNNSAYQDIGQDATMFEDIYTAPVQLPTPENGVFTDNYDTDKGLLDRFLSAASFCAPMITPEQQQQIARLQMLRQQTQQQGMEKQLFSQQPPQLPQLPQQSELSPLGEANLMLYTPESSAEDEGFANFAEPTNKSLDFVLFPRTPMNYTKTWEVVPDSNMFSDVAPSLAADFSLPNSQVFNMDWVAPPVDF